MKNYFKGIYERANLKELRSFLVFGAEDLRCYSTLLEKGKSYEERIEKINKETREVIDSKIQDWNDQEEVMNKVMEYVCDSDDVHMEVGIQCGFMLALQMMENMPKIESEK